VSNSEGRASRPSSHFFTAHTNGFRGGYASSRHSMSVAPIAKLPGKNGEMQRDYWYSSMRDAADLASPEAVGRYAAERTLSRLGSRKIPTTECPVLFESRWPPACWAALCRPSAAARSTAEHLLAGLLGKPIFPKHIDIEEDPLSCAARAARPSTKRACACRPARWWMPAVEGYFLSSYSARKLGMKTTGNAGGSHNLVMTSRRTKAGDDLDAMLKKLGTGLFVVELMGQGVNYVTGDYSRGASGFWVETARSPSPWTKSRSPAT
jgi:PmbA protein